MDEATRSSVQHNQLYIQNTSGVGCIVRLTDLIAHPSTSVVVRRGFARGHLTHTMDLYILRLAEQYRKALKDPNERVNDPDFVVSNALVDIISHDTLADPEVLRKRAEYERRLEIAETLSHLVRCQGDPVVAISQADTRNGQDVIVHTKPWVPIFEMSGSTPSEERDEPPPKRTPPMDME